METESNLAVGSSEGRGGGLGGYLEEGVVVLGGKDVNGQYIVVHD